MTLDRRGLTLLVILTIAWGINWPIMKLGVAHFPAMGFRMLCMVGGAIGLAIGQGAVLGLKFGVPKLFGESVVPTWAVAVSVVFCAMVGVVFGMLPAIKAARLDPIEALRHE